VSINAFPLAWPIGWKRTPAELRTASDTTSLLMAARILISDPNDWTQGTSRSFRPGTGECFCSIAAIHVNARFCKPDSLFDDSLYRLSKTMGGSVASFNDTHTHAEVLAAFDRAIEMGDE
jgi:hypothetical protein